MGTKTLMTLEQFLQLPDEESRRYELWQGELVEVGETILSHNWTRDELVMCVKLFVRRIKLGGEAAAETGIQFDTNTLARPDLCYWDAQHLASVDWSHSPVEVIPQLLAEVVSPSNSLRTLFRNAEYYLRAGVLVVWVVDLDPFQIHVFEPGKAKRTVRLGEMLDGGAALPGFSVDVSRFAPPGNR
jgi:Uma2 family endonuclease